MRPQEVAHDSGGVLRRSRPRAYLPSETDGFHFFRRIVIRLRVLGALDVQGSDGRELRTVMAQPKRAALLVYLALAGPRGFHRRDTLVAMFWPEHDAERARNALSQAVYFLRRALGADAIVTRNVEELGIDPDKVWCDAIAFDAALNARHPSEAVELYRGDLLEGFHVSDAPEFDRWLEAERARLADRWARAIEAMADEAEAGGDPAGAVTWLRRLAARHPDSSRIALRLMRAMAAAGDRAGAIRHARTHETVLREVLDATPDPDVVAFARALQDGTSHAPMRPAPVQTAPISPAPVSPAPVASAMVLPGAGGANPSAVTRPPAVTDPPVRTRRQAHQPRRRAMTVAALALMCAAAASAVALRSNASGAPDAKVRSLAVLPLENLSGDSTHESFAIGLHDALITELARYGDLTVKSRGAVLRYKGATMPLGEIARELGVDAFVLGTLFWEGGRVRMNAQLVHASDRHLWARTYQRDLRDVLLLQAELADSVARAVRVTAAPAPRRARMPSGPAGEIPKELYLRELYLRGRHAELSRSLLGVQTAREAYQRAIELDSTFALGYAGLAAVHGFMADYAYAPMEPALDSARMMAERAVALDSTLPEARTALAVALADARRFEAAEREFRRAIELGPSNARAHYWYAILLVALGRGEDALRMAGRAMELEAFPPRGLIAMQRYAEYLLTGERDYLKSVPVRERRPVLKLEPGEPWARAREAVELAEEERCAEARSEIIQAEQLVSRNNMRMQPYVGSVFWWCGDRARARALLARMKQWPNAHDHGLRMAWLHALFGETDSAFVWLGRHRWTMAELSALRADQALDPLRSDPRYPRLLDSLGVRGRHGGSR